MASRRCRGSSLILLPDFIAALSWCGWFPPFPPGRRIRADIKFPDCSGISGAETPASAEHVQQSQGRSEETGKDTLELLIERAGHDGFSELSVMGVRLKLEPL